MLATRKSLNVLRPIFSAANGRLADLAKHAWRARSMGTFLFLNHPPSHAFATAQGAGLRCVLKRTEKTADAKR
jgi:hypothetical protein